MKKFEKNLLISCIVTLILGVILIIIGISKGGKINYLIDIKAHSIQDLESVVSSDTVEVNEFKKIVITGDTCDIKIIKGDVAQVEYDIQHISEDSVKVNVDSGVLAIEIPSKGGIVFGWDEDNRIRIGLNPKDFTTKKYDNKVQVTVPSDFDLENIKMDIDVGDIEIIDVTANALDIKNDVGDIDCSGEFDEKIKVSTDTGNISIKNLKSCSLDASTDVGDIKYQTAGESDDYSYDLRNDVGKITVDKSDKGNKFKSENSNGLKLKAISDVGDIKVEFTSGK